MRQWSFDTSSENAFSPYSPFSPGSPRVTGGSLRSLPTNNFDSKSHGGGGKSFPSAPSGWGSDSGGDNSNSNSFADFLSPRDTRYHRRTLSGFESGHRRGRQERENEESLASHGANPYIDMALLEEEDNEENSQRGVRLSRHIPQREGMDMTVSAFNLLDSAPPTPRQQQQQRHPTPLSGGGGGALSARASRARASVASSSSVSPGATAVATAFPGGGGPGQISPYVTVMSSTTASFTTDSLISDDSSYMTSLYNEMLADKLTDSGRRARHHTLHHHNGEGTIRGIDRGLRARTSDGDSSSGRNSGGDNNSHNVNHHNNSTRRGGIGGEVFKFSSSSATTTTAMNAGAAPSTPGSEQASRPPLRARLNLHGSKSCPPARVLCTNPERVLDAPEFPADNRARLIDWGSNNKLIIGLKSSLYAWDGETGQASKMVELQGGLQIDCVQWLHKCACAALSVGGGTVAIYDCRSEDFIRTVRLPAGLGVTGIAVHGPVMAVSSNGPTGLTQAFDLRAKNALIATYEGHAGPITAMRYCSAEPFYLATGGEDGHVRVWDSRRSQAPRHAYDGVHQGPVTALCWNPDRRSRLFTGGDDGVLCLIDTHAASRTMADTGLGFDDEEACSGRGGGNSNSTSNSMTISGAAHYLTRAVKSALPISGLTVQNGEVLTSHRGQGQLQLRKAASFQLLGVFSAPNCGQSLSCLTVAPDRQVVCAAQGDETLKFWRVFDAEAPNAARKSGRDSGMPLHHDPVSRLEDQLR